MAKSNEGGAAVAEPKAETALSVFKKEFGVLATATNIAGVIAENLGGEKITPGDLTRVRWPSGGSLSFRLPTLDGSEDKKSLEGIMVFVTQSRSYWASKGVSKNPPDCSSVDMKVGKARAEWEKRPVTWTGGCETCPLAEFGSAIGDDGKPGAGQACKARSVVFLLQPGDLLPTVLRIPPSSLKVFKQFRLGLTNRQLPYWRAVVSLSLKGATSRGNGTEYAELVATVKSVLTVEEGQGLQAYIRTMQEVLSAAAAEEATRSDDDA